LQINQATTYHQNETASQFLLNAGRWILGLNTIRLDEIKETDIDRLITDKISEIKTIEFKQSLPGNSDGDKKEFLADVSSFANAAGGDLVYGVKAIAGIASEVCGTVSDVDSEILRLENILRDGISPRIPGVNVRGISISGKTPVVLIRIPRSWAQPHMVKFGGSSKFFSRNSAGKYQLDVGEIRAAFALSETTAEQIRGFRRERLAAIVAGETPVPLDNNPPRLILHSVPVAAFDPASRVDLSGLGHGNLVPLMPIGDNVSTFRRNFDGVVTATGDPQGYYSYLQVFRNGSVEAVRSNYVVSTAPQKIIPEKYEIDIIRALKRFLALQQSLGVNPPVYIMLSLLDVRGYIIGGLGLGIGLTVFPIEKQSLILPETELANFDDDITGAMKSVFDMVWNASGWPGSKNYDSNGKWIGR
jgi:hypothetical protein